MLRFIFGVLIGLLLAGGIWLSLPLITTPIVEHLSPQNVPTQAAATSLNVSQTAPTQERFLLSINLADSGETPSVVTSDLTSLSVTISRVEITPVSFRDPSLKVKTNHPEVVNLTQPTVELMSLKGSGALAELGTTSLAAGTYQKIRLTIDSLRGRKSSGQIIELPVTPANQQLDILLDQTWSPTTPIQIVIDLDTLSGLSQSGPTFTFKPVIRRLLVNDEPLASPIH